MLQEKLQHIWNQKKKDKACHQSGYSWEYENTQKKSDEERKGG